MLEQIDGLGGEREVAAVAQSERDAREQDQRAGGGLPLVAGAEGGERLLERGLGLARLAGLVGRLRPADQQLGPLGIVGRGELERAREPRFGLSGVEAERALAGKREEAPRRQGELRACCASPAASASSSACR